MIWRVVSATICCAGPAFADTAYFAAIRDLPIAPGLSESEVLLGTTFSGSTGDIILADAHGSAASDAVERFYGESLSALGWAYAPSRREDGMMFVRGRERLILHIEPRDGGTYLRVRLIARPAPSNAD